VAASLDPLGVDVSDVVVGDVLDETVVASAVQGCDAVVHAAAVFSLDSRRAEEMRHTNVRATELVLGQAVARGLDPVVHVSTTVALTRYAGSGPDLPLGDIELPYAQSKIASEEVARRLQDRGDPVVTRPCLRSERPVPRRPERNAPLDPAPPLPALAEGWDARQ
jgi:nucleoside-diphosphate-sugar epimerase